MSKILTLETNDYIRFSNIRSFTSLLFGEVIIRYFTEIIKKGMIYEVRFNDIQFVIKSLSDLPDEETIIYILYESNELFLTGYIDKLTAAEVVLNILFSKDNLFKKFLLEIIKGLK